MNITLCNIIGHKWKHYEDVVNVEIPASWWLGNKIHDAFTYEHNSNFRKCIRCSKKQIRNHNTGIDSKDWEDTELSKEEMRDKKLTDLGI